MIPNRCRLGPVTPDCRQRVVAFKRAFAANERGILVRSYTAQPVTRDAALKIDRTTFPGGATTFWQPRSFGTDQIFVLREIRRRCLTTKVPVSTALLALFCEVIFFGPAM